MTTARRKRRWSRSVTEHSHALDLDAGVFKGSPTRIARSLKRSAERSKRRKSTPFRSALSMITFFANRAGSKLSASRKRALERAKDELRKLYGRARGTASAKRSTSARRKRPRKAAHDARTSR